MIELTKEILEREVPVLISPDDDLLNRVSEAYVREVNIIEGQLLAFYYYDQNMYDTAILTPEEAHEALHTQDEKIAQAAVRGAVWRLVPQLDLVATQNGFGVVRNDHVAPASAERVAAMREGLLQEYEKLYAFIFAQFVDDARLRPATFLFSAGVARAAGLAMPDGAFVYQSDFDAMHTEVHKAEYALERCISPELYKSLCSSGAVAEYAALRVCQRSMQNLTNGLIEFLSACYSYVVSEVEVGVFARLEMGAATQMWRSRAVMLRRQLKDMLYKSHDREWAQPYFESTTYQADVATPYQNRQADPTFFFG